MHKVRAQRFDASTFYGTHTGKRAVKVEDDDIVAGPQKTSLKCPVSTPASHAIVIVALNASIFSAELWSYQYSVSLLAMCSCTVLRCHVVVFGE